MIRKRRMDAYYYGFDSTGVDDIDRLLSAVACAGKAFHHHPSEFERVNPRTHGACNHCICSEFRRKSKEGK